MMHLKFIHILKVIFVLSTIVTVTDCCSSRILLLREHTLKIVQHQHNFHNHLHEHAHQLQQQIEQHVVELVSQMEQQKNALDTQLNDVTEQTLLQWQDLGEVAATTRSSDSSTTTERYSTETLPGGSDTSTMQAATGEPPPDESSTAETANTKSKVQVQDYFNFVREVFACSGSYKTDFCLNGGRCFRFPLANHSFFSCECADGYVGERCESKSLNELYVPTPPTLEAQPKILMARIVFSFPMLILLSSVYVAFGAVFLLRSVPEQRRERLRKQRFFVSC